MIRVTDNHAARLAKMMPSRIMPAMGEELQSGAQAIEDTMRRNMNDGAISGSGHIPGPPGSYASSDTHKMEESIKAGELVETATEIKTSVSAGDSEAPYPLYVELGHSGVAPRPGLQLATEEHRSDITEAMGGRFIREINE